VLKGSVLSSGSLQFRTIRSLCGSGSGGIIIIMVMMMHGEEYNIAHGMMVLNPWTMITVNMFLYAFDV
jgi:hypothetical protein